ncbi:MULTISPECIES: ABC transporter permease [unclassified Mesorhizobium]|uniref:ABC transporter permease n=1 Tax=unclassified Mesorhizobium TaxID=325217 RepID=UPI0003CE7721|nr:MULTISPECIES: ABC transporter permease [unclassified Mesorhizobium]ESX27452.1 ABC transporter permease [Mesorhizobium sp. LSHC440B00]ESX35945.1 ABC transporter permease [Mesorhizobium sp. LSHC432A00]ESX41292.1 ABC transporter permease [Mesorhizobium sp. LSHC440A00]WJI55587.1 ABC transporter permease [Mesorhizobium sp. C432A]
MFFFIAKRARNALVLLFLASVLCFSLVVSAPGNVAILIAELRTPTATKADIAKVAEEIGLNKPLLIRYTDWLGNAAHGNFGISYKTGEDVGNALRSRLSVTATLVAGGAVVALVLSLLIGFLGALWAHRMPDHIARGLALFGASTPSFFVGALLVYAFSVSFKIFPTFGYDGFRSFILPWLTIAMLPAAVLSRVVRVGLEEAMARPFVLTAMSKGFKRERILMRDALPNIAPTYLNALGTQIGLMVVGAVVVEPLFAWQGVAELFLTGVRFRDFMVVQACLLIFITFFIILNVIVDVLMMLTDPRMRRQRSGS